MSMRRVFRGFTLIELLVVIAIIAILAAIIFPVYARAKVAAYRSSDISNMNSIRNALQLYRADQGAYPPALLGYATLYTNGPGTNVVPAEQLRSFLYSKRINSVDVFRPALNRVSASAMTNAVWPTQDPRAVGSAPILDLNGDGVINAADDVANSRQANGPTVTVQRGPAPGKENIDGTTNAWFYSISGYDVSVVKPGGNAQCAAVGAAGCNELRYTLFWTISGLGGGASNDDPRQLGYNEPPDNTVITWDSYFRDYSGGNVQRNKNEIVLFLGGAAKPYDTVDARDRSWRMLP